MRPWKGQWSGEFLGIEKKQLANSNWQLAKTKNLFTAKVAKDAKVERRKGY
jgi:hypothetical protein